MSPAFSGWTLVALAVAWVLAQALMVHGWLPGAFLALVPFSLGVARSARRRGALFFAFFGGWVLFLAAEYFLSLVSRGGWVMLAFWQAATLLPVALALRWLHSRWGVPLAFALPIAWVGGEFLRNLGPLALPTGMLMGPCYDQLWMIQVCDLAGVYGGNCALALINGLLADAFLAWREGAGGLTVNRSLRVSVLATLGIWLFIPAYGWFRLAEARDTMHPGPTIAVVQPDIPYRTGIEHGFDPESFLGEMLARSEQARTVQPPPEFIVWPEAMSTMPILNSEWLNSLQPLGEEHASMRETGRATLARLREWVRQKGTPLLLGSVVWLPPAVVTNSWRIHNSAMLVTPDTARPEPRQLKMRLFPGGEQIPWKGTWAHRAMVWALRLGEPNFLPPELEPGDRREVFSWSRGRERHILNLCYEILFPASSGVFLRAPDGGKPFDYLVNISNDGRFLRSDGQLIHWRNLPYRAVEARIGITRAANTGISGFVKPTGEIYGQVTNAAGQIHSGLGAPELALIADVVQRRQREDEILHNPAEYERLTNDIARIADLRAAAGVAGQSVQQIYTDTRRTLYSRIGDVLPAILLGVTLASALGALAPRWRG